MGGDGDTAILKDIVSFLRPKVASDQYCTDSVRPSLNIARLSPCQISATKSLESQEVRHESRAKCFSTRPLLSAG
jgi:hypothetical protein